MPRHLNVRRDLYTSKTASDITSETFFVGDARAISFFIRGSPSTTTIQGSNADGRSNDITNTTDDWSDLSTVLDPSPDMIDIEPGFEYVRLLRSETTEVILKLQQMV
jgi:hypothetical protein